MGLPRKGHFISRQKINKNDNNIITDTIPTQDFAHFLFNTLNEGNINNSEEMAEDGNLALTRLGESIHSGNFVNSYNNIIVEHSIVNAPLAYLNILVFSNNMELIPASSRRIQVSGGSLNNWEAIRCYNCVSDEIAIDGVPDGGYVLMTINNNTIGKDVWFDDIDIIHQPSKVIEENHYYPFGLTISNVAAGSVEQPHKYQGIELEKNFGLELFETYYRGLDPQLGRFLQVDPKAELDVSISPYVSMRNNPIFYIDPLGDKVRVSGKDAAKKTFQEISDNAMGGYYKTSIDDNGNVSFTKTDKEGKMSRKQKAYHKEISKILNKKETVEIELVGFDKAVVGGSFTSGKIDVDDVYSIGNDNEAMTSGSVLAHEMAEQDAKQTKGYNYNQAHEVGKRVEERITGYRRDEDRQINNTYIEPNKKSVSGTIIIPYINENKIINVNIILEWNNIMEVKEEVQK